MSHALNLLNQAREREALRRNALRTGKIHLGVGVLGTSDREIGRADERLREMLDEMITRLHLTVAGEPTFTTDTDERLRSLSCPVADGTATDTEQKA